MDTEDETHVTPAVRRADATLGGDGKAVADADDARWSAGAAIRRGGGARGASVTGRHHSAISRLSRGALTLPYEEEYVDEYGPLGVLYPYYFYLGDQLCDERCTFTVPTPGVCLAAQGLGKKRHILEIDCIYSSYKY